MPIETGRMAVFLHITSWPPSGNHKMAQHEEGDRQVVLFGLESGRLQVWRIEGKLQPTLLFESAQIRPIRLGEIFIEAWYEGPRGGVRINGNELPPSAEGGPVIDVATRLVSIPAGESTSHPDAIPNCQVWIKRRRSAFVSGTPRALRAGRRLKTFQEQADELFIGLQNLAAYRMAISSGRESHLGALASLLRSLVFWVNDDRPHNTYNPLLLRLAATADLPLPVYDSGTPVLPPEGVHQPVQPGQLPPYAQPAFDPNPRVYQVLDLQEYLSTQRFYFLTKRPDGTLVGKRLTYREIISEYSNTMGISHFDEDAPLFIDVFKTMSSSEQSVLELGLCGIADIVTQLGSWVLGQLVSRGLIAPLPVLPLRGTPLQSQPTQTA
jgi:hypothetical protein